MKTVGILIPCFNEQDNIRSMVESIGGLFADNLKDYSYTIVFIDNSSTDRTVEEIKSVCAQDDHVKAILNARNFVWSSFWHGIVNTPGDCVICIPADFQVPPETIKDLIREWEDGGDVVCLIKDSSEERASMWLVRQLFYRLASRYSDGETLPNFTGGLYSRGFLDVCISIDDPLMYFSLRSFICTHGYNIREVHYQQAKRKSGKSKNNIRSLFHISLMRFTETSSLVPYLSFMTGLLMMSVSLLAIVVYSIANLLFLHDAVVNSPILLFAIFFVGGIPLLFIGLLGEYLMKMNGRLKRYPIVIEKERINF